MATRRDALVGLAAGSASAVVLAQAAAQQPAFHAHDEPTEAGNARRAQTPQTFQGRDYDTIAALCELIIPRTETPGAIDVGVPWRIDQAVSGKPALQTLYRQGLSDLNGAAKIRGKRISSVCRTRTRPLSSPRSAPAWEGGRTNSLSR